MNIKTHRHVISSLRGANFRRATFDGRARLLREIRTLRYLEMRRDQGDKPHVS